MKGGKELGLLVLILVLCVASAIMNPAFASPTNIQNTARLVGIYGTFSVGMALVIITGGIDLSVGSAFALLGVGMVMLMSEPGSPLRTVLHLPDQVIPWAACALAVAAGALLGLVHGLLVTKVKLQPFIVTLCGLLFYRGLARYVAHDEAKGFAGIAHLEWLRPFATGNLPPNPATGAANPFAVPIPFVVMVVVAAAFFVLLHKSVWGRYLFAVGRNEEAARYAGIRSNRIVISAYVLCGLCVGLSTMQWAFYTNSITPSTHGNFYELYAIAAAVLGGCSLRGGEGSIVGVLLGAALLQVLRNLVNLLGISSSLDFAVMGAVIMVGVLADQLLRSRRSG